MQVQTIDYADPAAADKFAASLRDTGFAVLTNHPIPRSLLERLYSNWLDFFHDASRRDYLFDPDGKYGVQEGYVPAEVSETAVGESTRDLKEFFNVKTDGRMPAHLAADIQEYRQRALALGKELVDWIEARLPSTVQLSEPLSAMLSDDESLLRVIHYPPLAAAQDLSGVRAASHEDINIVTVLPASEQPGLQAKSLDGTWHDLASRKGDLIINAGDMLQEATDRFIPSTTHRVVNPTRPEHNVSRIAIPYFLGARTDVVLSERYTAGAYRAERLHNLNPEHH